MFWTILSWIAKISALAAIVPILLILFGEPGTGPAGLRDWLYLAFFPLGFSLGYLIAMRWPIVGGCIGLACMAVSLLIVGRFFPISVYVIWGILCLPGILLITCEWKLRTSAR